MIGTASQRFVVLSVVLAVASLFVYCVARGYHEDAGLMATVIAVRLAAAIGIGMVAALLVAVGMLVLRVPGVRGASIRSLAATSSLSAVALVVYNLF